MVLLQATGNELAVDSFFAQSYGTYKQRAVSETMDFFSIWLIEQKIIHFDHTIEIRIEPAWREPIRPGRNAV